jgi:hypothetical protein
MTNVHYTSVHPSRVPATRLFLCAGPDAQQELFFGADLLCAITCRKGTAVRRASGDARPTKRATHAPRRSCVPAQLLFSGRTRLMGRIPSSAKLASLPNAVARYPNGLTIPKACGLEAATHPNDRKQTRRVPWLRWRSHACRRWARACLRSRKHGTRCGGECSRKKLFDTRRVRRRHQ